MTEKCDMCETPLVSIHSIGWALRLCHHRKGPSDGPEMDEPELDSSYYFCNKRCLKEWLESEDLPKKPCQNSVRKNGWLTLVHPSEICTPSS